eukprot:1159242-Pelagomonas_calceolata.AAC.4
MNGVYFLWHLNAMPAGQDHSCMLDVGSSRMVLCSIHGFALLVSALSIQKIIAESYLWLSFLDCTCLFHAQLAALFLKSEAGATLTSFIMQETRQVLVHLAGGDLVSPTHGIG